MTAPLTDQIIDRLKDAVPELRQRVAGAVDFAALVRDGQLPQRLPAAFVLWAGDDNDASLRANAPARNRLTETVSVVVIDGVAGDATGARSQAKAAPLREAIMAALIDWQPAGSEALTYRRGRLQGVTGAVFYQLDFASTRNFVNIPTS